MKEKDIRMFEIFFKKRKPKNALERLEFSLWRACGISPSKYWLYALGTRDGAYKSKLYGGENDG